MNTTKQSIMGRFNSIVDFFVEITHSSSRLGFWKYFRNTSWLFVGEVAGLLASFIVGLSVARYLGPSDYGLIVYAGSFGGAFSFIVAFSAKIISRELVDRPEDRDKLLGTAFVLRLLGAFVAMTSIIIALSFMQMDVFTNVLIIIYSLILFLGTFGVIDLYFKSKVLGKKVILVQVISLIGISIIKLICIYFGVSAIYFAGAALLYQIFIAIGFVRIYLRSGLSMLKWRWDGSLSLVMV